MLQYERQQFTNRAVLYVGFPCNLKCGFCYYATRQNKQWNSLEHCKQQASLFRYKFHNRLVDLTGGEPTIYPHILPLITHCVEIDLKPTIITNMQKIAKADVAKQLQKAGAKEFLCSVHGLYNQHDEATGVPGSFLKAINALDNLGTLQMPFRINTTITNLNYKQLKDIAKFVSEHGCQAINFISCNIFERQRKSAYLQVTFSELQPYLHEALNYCDSIGLIAKVRYVPFCFMEGHEDKCYNFRQLPYDPHEWDYKSWLSPDATSPDIPKFHENNYQSLSEEDSYQFLAGKLLKINYTQTTRCKECALSNICDGLNRRYVERFGDKELRPQYDEKIIHPNHFLC